MAVSAKHIAKCALLVCAALTLSLFEGALPAAMIPIPGIKLGLANIVVLYALYRIGRRHALMILSAKCILAAVFGGGVTSLVFSMCGGVLALMTMCLLKRLDGRFLTVFGVSVAGAAMHGVGQIIAAAVLMRSAAVAAYLPILLLSGIFTGAITGAAAALIFKRI